MSNLEIMEKVYIVEYTEFIKDSNSFKFGWRNLDGKYSNEPIYLINKDTALKVLSKCDKLNGYYQIKEVYV